MTIKRNGPAGVSAPATLAPPERSRGAYLQGKPFTATPQPIYYSIPRRTAAVAVDTLEAIEWHIEMECSTRGLKDSTLARKRSVLGQLAERCPQLPATADDIRAILNQGGKRPSTKKAQLSHLNMFFASIGPRYGVSNPCREIGSIKVRDSRAWALTEEQIDKVLLACRTPLEIVLVVAFLDTGLRLQEMSDLRVSDIRGNWISVSAETKSGRRDVPLSAELREQMLLLARGEYIWCGTEGPLSYGGIGGRIRQIVKRAGITGPLVGPHLLPPYLCHPVPAVRWWSRGSASDPRAQAPQGDDAVPAYAARGRRTGARCAFTGADSGPPGSSADMQGYRCFSGGGKVSGMRRGASSRSYVAR